MSVAALVRQAVADGGVASYALALAAAVLVAYMRGCSAAPLPASEPKEEALPLHVPPAGPTSFPVFDLSDDLCWDWTVGPVSHPLEELSEDLEWD